LSSWLPLCHLEQPLEYRLDLHTQGVTLVEKSAYLVLGLPGNATQADIHETYRRLSASYSQERLASDGDARKLYREIQEAYALLKAPELRAAYDRELSGMRKQPMERPVSRSMQENVTPLYRQPWLILLVLLVSVGVYAAHHRSVERQEAAARAAAQAAELKRKEAEEALLAQRKLDTEMAALEREQLRKQREDESRERQERQAAESSAARAASAMERQQDAFRRQQDAARRDAEREELKVQQAERQRVQEAERRLAKEKQALRELCYQRYGRHDC
jgi:curved DNA-binding protein CbpA